MALSHISVMTLEWSILSITCLSFSPPYCRVLYVHDPVPADVRSQKQRRLRFGGYRDPTRHLCVSSLARERRWRHWWQDCIKLSGWEQRIIDLDIPKVFPTSFVALPISSVRLGDGSRAEWRSKWEILRTFQPSVTKGCELDSILLLPKLSVCGPFLEWV